MKNRVFSAFFSMLISLSMILGVNNFCYAEGGDITKVTAELAIQASNAGLYKGDIVSFDVYLNLVPDEGENIESIDVGAITLVVTPSDNITYDSYTVNNSLKTGSVDSFDESTSTFSLAKIGGIAIGTGATGSKGTLITTLKYQLNENSSTVDSVSLAISTEQFVGSSVCDTSATESKAITSTDCTYNLKDKPACEHTGTESADWETVTPPTCTEKGTKTWTCPECNEEIKVDIDPLGHSFKWTAIDDNQHQEKCERESCADTNGDPEDHIWDSYEPIDDTQHKKTCSRCGHSVDEPHNFPSEWTPDNNATCTKNGTKHKECPNCHKTIYADNDEDPATGHTWDEGVVTQAPTYLADGVRTYTCQNCGATRTETIPKLTHDDPTAGVQYWGTREVYNGHEMYVDEEGRTSALVTGNERIWLREESYDPAAGQNLATWYMIDNTNGVFELGSRFWVKWLNNKDNPEEFSKYYGKIDRAIRDRIDSNRVWIFLVGVTKPDGTTEYKTLSQEIPLYIQMGTDWDYSDIKAMYISDSADEEVYASYLNMEYPEGKGEFAKLGLKHFSPYAIYDYLTDEEKAEFDKLTDEEKAAVENKIEELAAKQEEQSATSAESKPETSSSSSGVKTGDETGYIVLMSSALFIIAGLYLELCMKKKRN